MSPEHHDKIQVLLGLSWHLPKDPTKATVIKQAHYDLLFLKKFIKDKGFKHITLTPQQKRMIDTLYGKWVEGKRK